MNVIFYFFILLTSFAESYITLITVKFTVKNKILINQTPTIA